MLLRTVSAEIAVFLVSCLLLASLAVPAPPAEPSKPTGKPSTLGYSPPGLVSPIRIEEGSYPAGSLTAVSGYALALTRDDGKPFGPVPSGSLVPILANLTYASNGTPIDGVVINASTSLGDEFVGYKSSPTLYEGKVAFQFYAVNIIGPATDQISIEASILGVALLATANITVKAEPFPYTVITHIGNPPYHDLNVTSGGGFSVIAGAEYHGRPMNGIFTVITGSTGSVLGEGLGTVASGFNLSVSVLAPEVLTTQVVNYTASEYELGLLIAQASFFVIDHPVNLTYEKLPEYFAQEWQPLSALAFAIVPSVLAAHFWARSLAGGRLRWWFIRKKRWQPSAVLTWTSPLVAGSALWVYAALLLLPSEAIGSPLTLSLVALLTAVLSVMLALWVMLFRLFRT